MENDAATERLRHREERARDAEQLLQLRVSSRVLETRIAALRGKEAPQSVYSAVHQAMQREISVLRHLFYAEAHIAELEREREKLKERLRRRCSQRSDDRSVGYSLAEINDELETVSTPGARKTTADVACEAEIEEHKPRRSCGMQTEAFANPVEAFIIQSFLPALHTAALKLERGCEAIIDLSTDAHPTTDELTKSLAKDLSGGLHRLCAAAMPHHPVIIDVESVGLSSGYSDEAKTASSRRRAHSAIRSVEAISARRDAVAVQGHRTSSSSVEDPLPGVPSAPAISRGSTFARNRLIEMPVDLSSTSKLVLPQAHPPPNIRTATVTGTESIDQATLPQNTQPPLAPPPPVPRSRLWQFRGR
eukprot:TRINITY_DN10294_c0_g1_i1.p1 TRINITY_DN10294_c0_g1~~TRINITY_DN10294_c0_g1_i1.p1  ORF type:complete len:397 (-),score=64.16 TRINITY_DN10294_c0_g1_i1:462-1550(-)